MQYEARVAEAVYGFALWSRGPAYQTASLEKRIRESLAQGDKLITQIENYPVHTPEGPWRWYRDRESFSLYKKKILKEGWAEIGLSARGLDR